MGGFFLSCATYVFNFSIGTILQWSILGYCNLNTYEDEEVAFIGTEKRREHCNGGIFDEISKDNWDLGIEIILIY